MSHDDKEESIKEVIALIHEAASCSSLAAAIAELNSEDAGQKANMDVYEEVVWEVTLSFLSRGAFILKKFSDFLLKNNLPHEAELALELCKTRAALRKKIYEGAYTPALFKHAREAMKKTYRQEQDLFSKLRLLGICD